ncbi:MAG: hypothetical protein KH828_07540 [Clostridiales bacterium]|nr:hypothetical protein [Clostridiales bacterium]
MKKLWKKFDELKEKCYMNMIGADPDFEVWNKAFDVLMDIISTGRKNDPNYAKELVQLEETTDFSHDISGWLEDYLSELDMRERYVKVQEVCEKLLDLFCWEEDSSSDLRFYMASALQSQGKNQQALDFCEKWYEAEKDNIVAATALIYARMHIKDLDGAEKLVKKYISDDTICTDENDIVFTAAAILYKTKGNKKEEKRINKAIKQYEEELEAYCTEMDEEDFDFDFLDDELPFN